MAKRRTLHSMWFTVHKMWSAKIDESFLGQVLAQYHKLIALVQCIGIIIALFSGEIA